MKNLLNLCMVLACIAPCFSQSPVTYVLDNFTVASACNPEFIDMKKLVRQINTDMNYSQCNTGRRAAYRKITGIQVVPSSVGHDSAVNVYYTEVDNGRCRLFRYVDFAETFYESDGSGGCRHLSDETEESTNYLLLRIGGKETFDDQYISRDGDRNGRIVTVRKGKPGGVNIWALLMAFIAGLIGFGLRPFLDKLKS